jgi:DNA-binding transcriptional regulator YdaS (Cro superfamily)
MTTEPNWITVLRESCEGSSQAAVARRIGYSPTVVNQVLKGRYGGPHGGDLDAVRKAVEGALMGLSVDCPVIGELPRDRCLAYQRRGFAATNPLRVALTRACPQCPNRRGAP